MASPSATLLNFTFPDHRCWLEPSRVKAVLTSPAQHRVIDDLAIGGRLPSATRVLEELQPCREADRSGTRLGLHTTANLLGLQQGGCPAPGPHIDEILREVTASLRGRSPLWERDVTLVEAIEVVSPEHPYEWFVFYDPDPWTIFQDAHLKSLDQIDIEIPGDNGPVGVKLTGAGGFHRLALHVPCDAARALLIYLHNECGPSPEGGSAVEFVNRLPDTEVQGMIEISRSSAPVVCHSRPGSTYPGYVADLWDIYRMVRPDH